jgi:protein TonB
MFEDSLFASRVDQVSSRKRWTVAASVGLQVAVAAVVMVLPLLHPEALPFRYEAPRVLVPRMPKPPVPVEVQRDSAASSASVALPGAAPSAAMPSLLPGLHPVVGDAPELASIRGGMGMPDGLLSGIESGDGPRVSVAPAKAPAGLVRISSLSPGMLVAAIRPVYPVIAKAAHVEGTVVVEALISRTGTIESLRVVSGPEILRRAALDAIREARYQPYRLNGEPTAVDTTITVNFRLGGS